MGTSQTTCGEHGLNHSFSRSCMKQTEIKERTDKDVRDKLAQLRERMRILRFDLAAGKVKNVREMRAVKKDIARILTEIRLRVGNQIT